ncbi:MAG: hypothetical protein N2746_04050 [Deltaproteobacteria bacterium]|nr:hypothetical protein [Deltaproteobacteria bacterium]
MKRRVFSQFLQNEGYDLIWNLLRRNMTFKELKKSMEVWIIISESENRDPLPYISMECEMPQ